jgi:hypothetical protein
MNFSKFRFWLAMKLLNIMIMVIDKNTLEGLSFVIAIDEWVNFIEHSTPKGVNK